MADRPAASRNASVWTVALIALAALFAAVAIDFARRQSVWTDESTQLSGLTLGLVDQLRWLAGKLPHAFAVPPDRMPPLGYWLGDAWIAIFGNHVWTLRLLSVSLSVGSVLLVYAAARRFLDRRYAFICAALLALSPNFLAEAAEIRAYAAFIFFSTLLIYFYLKLISARPEPAGSDLWGFAVAGTLCSFTHFFGVVVSASASLCLLLVYIAAGSRDENVRALRRTFWPAVFYLLSLLALVPFIRASIGISGGSVPGDAVAAATMSTPLHDLVRLIYRFFSHQSMLGVPHLPAAAMLAGVALIAFAAVPGSDRRAKQMLLFLMATLALITLAGFAAHGFNAFTPSYNVWALPVIALISTSTLTHPNRYVHGASVVCLCAIALADGYGLLNMARHGEIYGHTRSAAMTVVLEGSGPADATVLYINDAPSLYFALTYSYGDRLRQYVAQGNRAQRVGSTQPNPPMLFCDLKGSVLLLAADQQLSADELQYLSTHPSAHTEALRALDKFVEDHRAELAPHWEMATRNEYLAQSALALAVFRGTGSDASCGPASAPKASAGS